MNYDSPPHHDMGDYPDSPSGEGRKVYSGFGEPGSVTRVQDVPAPATETIFGGRYETLPVFVAIVILITTPIFGSSVWWLFLSVAVLVAALVIAFLFRKLS
jgi:hypothetical protein